MPAITAAAAIDRLRAAGHIVTRTNGRDAARRYGCQTLMYVIDGRAVNLGRLRQLAQELPAAEPVADPEPAARAPYAELIGDAAARFARFARCYRLTPAQAREIRAEVWRWAAGYGLESEGAPYVWIRGGMAAALVRRGVLIPRHGFGHLWEPEALAILREIAQAQAAAEAAPQAEPVPADPAAAARDRLAAGVAPATITGMAAHVRDSQGLPPVPAARAEWMVAPWRGQPLPPMRAWPLTPAV